MSKDIDIRQELLRSVISVVRHKEFYGHVVQQFEKVFVRDGHAVDTAAVGLYHGEKFVKLTYNEDYFRRIYEEQMGACSDFAEGLKAGRLIASGATEHEILHVILGHLELRYADKDRLAVAADLVVNQIIPNERRHASWLMPEDYDFEPNHSVKWYYDQLANNTHFKRHRKVGFLESIRRSHQMWDAVSDDPMPKEFLRDILRKARDNTSSKGWGALSAGIKEAVDQLTSWHRPSVSWVRVLRGFCASAEERYSEYTKARKSRRFGTRPGIRKRDRLRVAVIVDTSASISCEELRVFFNEIRWVWRTGASVRIFEADTKIVREYEFRGNFEGTVKGRGGTNLEVPLCTVDKQPFDCIVYFTDFEAPTIDTIPCKPVLWALCSPPEKDNWPCQWGTMLALDVENCA